MWAFLLHLMCVVGWKLAPKKIHPCQSLEHLNLLEKRIFAYAVKLFWDEKVIYTGPKCHHKFPHKKRQRQMWHKQSRTHCEYRGKGWSDVSTSQSRQRLEEGRNRFFSEFSEAVQPCNSLSSDLRRNDKPRQCIKKQRHYFTDKCPYSQSYSLLVVMYRCESWTIKKNCGFGEDSWKSLGLQGDQTSRS